MLKKHVVAVSTSHVGVFDGVTEFHKPFGFRRVDSSGDIKIDAVPGFYWFKPLEDAESTLSELKSKLTSNPRILDHDIAHLFDPCCPLDDQLRQIVDHSSELPIIQVIKRMKNKDIEAIFPPSVPKNQFELLSYGIVHNHWIAGATYFLSKELNRSPTEHEIHERMKLNDSRFYQEFRAYWTIMRDIFQKDIHLVMPSNTNSWSDAH